ncbi:MAG: flagellar M-ring protein FliF [Candidatus Firestonebacteria bacterium]|nr:flagellar M-ring protein FliF [Candidatus Firestonebacteria bacterium]
MSDGGGERAIEYCARGQPRGESVGFEIFDKMSFGTTDEVQRINYLRALQSELERTIDSMDAVEKSRVHLVIPSEDLWFEDQVAPTASVLIKLHNGGNLLPRQVDSIRHMLASAVRGLTPERVTVVDTAGHVLSAAGDAEGLGGLSDRQITYKKKVEDNIKTQAETMLTEIYGPGKAVVRVAAEINFNQTLTERESYTPIVGRQGLVRSEKQNMFESAQDNAAAGGVAGTASNLQGYPPSAALNGDKSTKKNERVINYEMNRTVERVNTASGTIRQLSIGIFVDGKFTPEQLGDLSTVLSRGLGIIAERGDKIEVKAMSFNRKGLEEDRQAMEKSQKEQFWLQVLTRWVPLALLMAAAVVFLAVALKNLQKVGLNEGKGHGGGNNGNGGSPDDMNPEIILGLLKQNTGASAQVLKHWLS